jgi:DNA-binding FrmR family transcriptional regulator
MENDKTPEQLWAEELAAREGTAEKPLPQEKQDEPAVAEQAEPEVQATEKPAEPPKPTTEELLQQALDRVAKLEGRTRNVEGHIGGLNDQQKAIKEQLSAARSAAAEVKDAPTQDQLKAAVSNPEEWEKLKEDFPEWSRATEGFLNAKLSGIKAGADEATVQRLVGEAVEKTKGELTQTIVDSALNAVFPGWKADINTPEFADWMKAQDQETQALAASDDIGDAARMLSLYRESKKANPAQQILDQRKQKLQASVAAPRGSAKVVQAKTWEQMTPDERWNYEAKQREKERA